MADKFTLAFVWKLRNLSSLPVDLFTVTLKLPSSMEARRQEEVFQKTGSGSYQSIKAWACKLVHHKFCHILLLRLRALPDLREGVRDPAL